MHNMVVFASIKLTDMMFALVRLTDMSPRLCLMTQFFCFYHSKCRLDYRGFRYCDTIEAIHGDGVLDIVSPLKPLHGDVWGSRYCDTIEAVYMVMGFLDTFGVLDIVTPLKPFIW